MHCHVKYWSNFTDKSDCLSPERHLGLVLWKMSPRSSCSPNKFWFTCIGTQRFKMIFNPFEKNQATRMRNEANLFQTMTYPVTISQSHVCKERTYWNTIWELLFSHNRQESMMWVSSPNRINKLTKKVMKLGYPKWTIVKGTVKF